MTSSQLDKLLAAPELAVVQLTASTLRALCLALHAQHPRLDHDLPAEHDPPARRRARLLLRRAIALRRALGDYRRHVNRSLRLPPKDDLPF